MLAHLMRGRPTPLIRRLEDVKGWKYWVFGGVALLFAVNITVFWRTSNRVRDQLTDYSRKIAADAERDMQERKERRERVFELRLQQLRAAKSDMQQRQQGAGPQAGEAVAIGGESSA